MPKRRGRIPTKYMQALEFLKSAKGYENGKTISEIASHLYGGRTDFQAKAMARQIIGAARRAMKERGFNVDIFSIKPVGMPERRYCYLVTSAEYTKAINDLQSHIEGTAETEEELRRRRATTEERARLEEARKARVRSARQQT